MIAPAATAMLLVALLAGCSSTGVSLRSAPKSPLVEELKLTARGGPRPSDRTMQLLRVHNLSNELQGDPQKLAEKLQAIADREMTAENVYALAELSFLGAKKAEMVDKKVALDLYGASVLHAYHYLFDERLAATRNPYDPQFRGACDLYNGALEGALRIVCEKKELVPGANRRIDTAAGSWDITCVIRGSQWKPEDFGRVEFASDYEIKGLKNHYQSHGLGVPLIVVRKSPEKGTPAEKYHPPDLSFAVTAILRPLPNPAPPNSPTGAQRQGVLELYDPLATREIDLAGQKVSLESDLTTPLAYFLSKPQLESLAWVGLLRPEMLMSLRPDRPTPIMGLYMAQKYEPGKIPVVLVHGLWSSPMTWMEMFNDLRSTPEIRDRYQFWFYLYPTGQPFWLSAAQLRKDLAEAREVLDPQHREAALDQTVLDRPQHGRAAVAHADRRKRRGFLEARQRSSVRRRAGRRGGEAAVAAGVLLPAEPVGPPRGDHRHAAPRQQFLEPDHAMAAGQADPLAADGGQQPAEAVPREPKGVCGRIVVEGRYERRFAVARVPGLPRALGQPPLAGREVSQHRGRGAADRLALIVLGRRRRRGVAAERTLGGRRLGVHRPGRPLDRPFASGRRARSPPHSLGAPRRVARPAGHAHLRSAGGSDSRFCRTQSHCVQWQRCHGTGRSETPSYNSANGIIRRAARHLGRPPAGRAVVDSTVNPMGGIAGKPPCGILCLRCW